MGNCYNTVRIAANPDRVWSTMRDFHDMSWCPNVITGVSVVGSKAGDEPGAGRILNGAFHETLRTLDDEQMTFTYSIDDGPGPVASDAVDNYIGKVKVSADGDGTLVEWSSSFGSAEDSEVENFCNPIYRAVLSDLEAYFS